MLQRTEKWEGCRRLLWGGWVFFRVVYSHSYREETHVGADCSFALNIAGMEGGTSFFIHLSLSKFVLKKNILHNSIFLVLCETRLKYWISGNYVSLCGVGNLVSLLVVKGKADNDVSYASEKDESLTSTHNENSSGFSE